MEPEPEPMTDDIISQDILLDDIKEYRKLINGLLYRINNKINENDECKTILNDFKNLMNIEPFNYDYAYIGYENIMTDVKKHKKYISEIMERLKNSQDTECDNIYNECYSCYIYQYYYLGNYNYQVD
jgi:hypothetical protein